MKSTSVLLSKKTPNSQRRSTETTDRGRHSLSPKRIRTALPICHHLHCSIVHPITTHQTYVNFSYTSLETAVAAMLMLATLFQMLCLCPVVPKLKGVLDHRLVSHWHIVFHLSCLIWWMRGLHGSLYNPYMFSSVLQERSPFADSLPRFRLLAFRVLLFGDHLK